MIDIYTFNQVVSNYQPRFIRFATTYLHNEMEAEDIVMESFMYYWENKNRLLGNTNIPAYILTTIKHKCIDKLRQQQLRQEVTKNIDDLYSWELNSRIITLENFDPHELFTKEIESIITISLAQLPEQTREIFLMSRYENKTYKEIATICGMTTKGVEFHISKAIKSLRNDLKDYIPFFISFISILR